MPFELHLPRHTRFSDQEKRQWRADVECALGNHAFNQGKWDEALLHFGKAVDFYPEDPIHFANRAAALVKLNRFEEVIRDCNTCLAALPDNYRCLGRRAWAQVNLGHVQDALLDAARAKELEPSMTTLIATVEAEAERRLSLHDASTTSETSETEAAGVASSEAAAVQPAPAPSLPQEPGIPVAGAPAQATEPASPEPASPTPEQQPTTAGDLALPAGEPKPAASAEVEAAAEKSDEPRFPHPMEAPSGPPMEAPSASLAPALSESTAPPPKYSIHDLPSQTTSNPAAATLQPAPAKGEWTADKDESSDGKSSTRLPAPAPPAAAPSLTAAAAATSAAAPPPTRRNPSLRVEHVKVTRSKKPPTSTSDSEPQQMRAPAPAPVLPAEVSDDEELLPTPLTPGERAMSLLEAKIGTGEYDDMEVFNQAVKLAPDDPDLYTVRGMAHISRSEITHAVRDFSTALSLLLLNKDAHKLFMPFMHRAEARCVLDDLWGASEDYRDARKRATTQAEGEVADQCLRTVFDVITEQRDKFAERVAAAQQGSGTGDRVSAKKRFIEELKARSLKVKREIIEPGNAAAWKGVEPASAQRQRHAAEVSAAAEENAQRMQRNALRAQRRATAAAQALSGRAPIDASRLADSGTASADEYTDVERVLVPIVEVFTWEAASSESDQPAGAVALRPAAAAAEEAAQQGSAAARPARVAAAPVQASSLQAESLSDEELRGRQRQRRIIEDSNSDSDYERPEPPLEAAHTARKGNAAPAAESAARGVPAAASSNTKAHADAAAQQAERTAKVASAMKAEAKRCADSGDHSQAVKLYAGYLSCHPGVVDAALELSQAKIGLGDFQGALDDLRALEESADIDQTRAFALYVMQAHALIGVDDLVEAVVVLDKAAAAAVTEKQVTTAHRMVTQVSEALERRGELPTGPSGAIKDSALSAHNRRLPARTSLIEEILPRESPPQAKAGGATSKAEQLRRPSAAPAPTPDVAPASSASDQSPLQISEAAREDGNALYKRKQYKAAAEQYKRALQYNPTCIRSWSNLAQALLKLEQWPEAERACTRALEMDPTYDKARYRRSVAYRRLSHREAAYIDLSVLTDSVPDNTQWRRELLQLQGEMYRRREPIPDVAAPARRPAGAAAAAHAAVGGKDVWRRGRDPPPVALDGGDTELSAAEALAAMRSPEGKAAGLRWR